MVGLITVERGGEFAEMQKSAPRSQSFGSQGARVEPNGGLQHPAELQRNKVFSQNNLLHYDRPEAPVNENQI